MISEKDLREQLALCTRMFAMQGMIGVFGHVSVYQPETKTVFITPGMGSDKGSLRPEQMVPTDLQGKPLSGKEGPPVEWPIHTALHGARADALAVAHLHTPHATLFAIAKRAFRPVTLQGAIFNDFGQAWYNRAYVPRVLGSAGIGFRTAIVSGLVLRLDVGNRYSPNPSARGIAGTTDAFYRGRFVDFFFGYDY